MSETDEDFAARHGAQLARSHRLRRWVWVTSLLFSASISVALIGWAYRGNLAPMLANILPLQLKLAWLAELSPAHSDSARVLETTYRGLDGDKVLGPVYRGVDSKGNPYQISASSAIEVKTIPGLFLLEQPIGILNKGRIDEVQMSGKTGRYDSTQQRLELNEDVQVTDRHGGLITAQTAIIQLDLAHIQLLDHVVGRGTTYRFTGKGLDVFWKEERTVLNGPARVRITSEQTTW